MKIPGWPGPILHLTSIDSTQDLARRMAEDGAPEWSLVIADRQTRGRGRLARTWASSRGGLYLSIILRPHRSPRFLARLSRSSAHTVAKALTAATGLQTAVKPPNDVLARANGSDWRKVCGILIEASGNSRRTDWVVIGIGVNVNNRAPANIKHASSLSKLAGQKFSLPETCAAVLTEFKQNYTSRQY